MTRFLVSARLNHRSRTLWTRVFAMAVMLLLAALLQGCLEDVGENAGETAARIVAEDVIPNLIGESKEWRKLAAETRDKLPAEFRHEFDLAFERAIAAAGAQYQCGVDFTRTRLRQDLEDLREKWLGIGTGPLPVPKFCKLYPDNIIKLDANNRPMDQNSLVFYGYDFTDYKNQSLVRVFLEDTNDRRADITKCCVDNPTNYNLTVDFDEVTFSKVKVRRIVLVSTSGQDLHSVGVSYASPAPPKPVLMQARVSFYTTDDNKDGDTRVNVNLVCQGRTVATITDTWGEFPDNSDSGLKYLTVLEHPPKDEIADCKVDLVEEPNGHDEWHFNWMLEVRYSDGTPQRFNFTGGNVDYDRTTQSWPLK